MLFKTLFGSVVVLALLAFTVIASAATPSPGRYHGFANDTNPTGPLPCGHDESEAYFTASKRAITPLKPPGACGIASLDRIVFPNENGCQSMNATIYSTKRIPVTSRGRFNYSHKEPIFLPFVNGRGSKGLVTVKGKWVSPETIKGSTTVKKGTCEATTRWTMVKAPVA